MDPPASGTTAKKACHESQDIALVNHSDMTASKATKNGAASQSDKSTSKQRESGWFAIPAPVRRVFDNFPLKTHAALSLPQRAPRRRDQNVLYLFASDAVGELSCNPACLKWQAYLKFSGIDFETSPSNNHASPNGSLPFILPSTQSPTRPSSPVPANKISKWVTSQKGRDDHMSMEYEAYNSLLDHRIRNAWLYTLYLDDSNFKSVAHRLYISSASSNRIVQATLAYQLRSAAREELLKSSNAIDEDCLYNDAENAFEALSTLLGNSETYSGEAQPGLFDASVFAYTHLLLNHKLEWKNTKMSERLKRFPRLVHHQERLADICIQH